MGFLNPIKTIGKGLSKLPGAKTLAKPINKALGKTPGLRGVPNALGMGPAKQRSPIAPSAGAVNRGVAGSMKNAATGGSMPPTGPAPPQMTAPPPMEMPPMQAPQMEMQQPQIMAPPMEQASLQGPIPTPQGQPQFDPQQLSPAIEMLKQRMSGNTGPIGRRPSGIGPRFMG